MYQLNLLTDSTEKNLVEAHLLSCESCFQECCHLSPALDLINEKPEYFMEAVRQKESSKQKKMTNLISEIFKWIWQAWSKPPVRILVPVCATVILAIIFVLPRPSSYSDLAVIRKAAYQPTGIRGQVQMTDSERLFKEAMDAYNRNQYDESIQKLNEYRGREPGNAHAQFYLGMSHLMKQDLNSGIEHLKISETLCRETENCTLLNQCLWTLANAYLKLGFPDQALPYLRKGLETEGANQDRIQTLIGKIEKMKDKEFKR